MKDAGSANDASTRLAAWVEEHGPAVFGYLLHLVRNRHLAEDLLQEVFCRAWAAHARYAEQGKARAYLLRIADRLVRLHRRRPVVIRVPLSDVVEDALAGEASPLERLEQYEHRRQLYEALALLSDFQRRTLLLRCYGNLEFSEIAAILGCPLNTALSHAHRGLRKLKDILAERMV
ncbi:MAG: sigma-70 family RNA polymerase sigma factor [Pirellulales bacterium]|nr:sigma-70 family RNA polymerase sigma factor [Pirellulales bacterium]